MTTRMINQAQSSLPSTTFGQDMNEMLDVGSSLPSSVLSGAVNDHMSGQMSNTVSDMMNFPEQAGDFKSNGIDSMVRGVGALHQNGGLDMVQSDTWKGMSGFGSDMSDALGFDPSLAAGGDLSSVKAAMAQRGQQSDGPSQGQAVAQDGIDGLKDGAKAMGKLAETGVEAETGVLKADAKVAGKVLDVGQDAAKFGGKALGGVEELAKSPAGKMLGKAALPLGLVGGAVALSSDAGTFGDAITDPFDTEKLGKARDALREDLPIPGAPLVIDAVTDPGKILDAGKDIGHAITHPSLDSAKKAGSKIMDELGF